MGPFPDQVAETLEADPPLRQLGQHLIEVLHRVAEAVPAPDDEGVAGSPVAGTVSCPCDSADGRQSSVWTAVAASPRPRRAAVLHHAAATERAGAVRRERTPYSY
jgi:hypothetical protein